MAKTLFIQVLGAGVQCDLLNIYYTLPSDATLYPVTGSDINSSNNGSINPIGVGMLLTGFYVLTPDNADTIVACNYGGLGDGRCYSVLTPGTSPSVTPTATATPTITPTVTPTITITATPTTTPSITTSTSTTPSITPSITPTITPSITVSNSATPSITPTTTPSISPTTTPSISPSISPSITPSITTSTSTSPAIASSVTPSATTSNSVTPTVTPTTTPSITTSNSVTPTVTPTVTPSITTSNSVTPTVTPSITPSITTSNSVTPTVTPTVTPSITTSNSVTPTVTPSITTSNSVTPTVTPTVTPSITTSNSVTPTVTPTITPTPTTPATIFSRSSSDYANEYFACQGTVSGIDFLYQTPGAGGGVSPAVSAQMYTNPGLTNTWTPASSGWYLLSYGANTYAVLPNSSGVLQTVYLCAGLPSQTPSITVSPTITPTKTPSITPTRTPSATPAPVPVDFTLTKSACGVGGNDPGKVSVTYSNFSGGSGGQTYVLSPTWYASEAAAIAGVFTNTPTGNPSTIELFQVPFGTWYFAVRDWLNTSNVTAKSITNDCIVPSVTPTQTPTPTMTPTPTQIPADYLIIGGYANATDACRGSAPTNTVYTTPGTTGMMAGLIFYNNSALTNTYNGNDNWHRMGQGGTTWGVLINTVGVVQSFVDCTAIPSNTPAPSPDPTPSVTPSETPPPPSPDPSPCASPPPPTIYTEFIDCASAVWYIEGDYTSGVYTSTEVSGYCLLSGFTTETSDGTLLTNISSGSCTCP